MKHDVVNAVILQTLVSFLYRGHSFFHGGPTVDIIKHKSIKHYSSEKLTQPHYNEYLNQLKVPLICSSVISHIQAEKSIKENKKYLNKSMHTIMLRRYVTVETLPSA